MSEKFYAVILSGGRGERFWPLSTARKPKQLLSLVGDKPLLAQAVERLEGLVPPDRVFVVTNQDLVAPTLEAAPMLTKENVVGEPIGRDTAAAVALSTALVKAKNPDASFCILTADHVIAPNENFQQTLRAALELTTREDALVTIGVQPDEPSTGFGYIEAENSPREEQGITFLPAKRFVEKPNKEKAEEYLASGNFFWNSGMFIWSVASIEKALRSFTPHLADMIDRLLPTIGTDDFESTLKQEFDSLEKISIDYAVMEKAKNIVMAKGTFTWDDVGSWPAVENHFERSDTGNVLIGAVEELDCSNNIVVSEERLTALIGVDDLVVVQAKGATLICKKERAQEVKKIVERLRASGSHDEVL